MLGTQTMNARALFLASLLAACSGTSARPPASTPPARPAWAERVTELCAATGQRPGASATTARELPETWPELPAAYGSPGIQELINHFKITQ